MNTESMVKLLLVGMLLWSFSLEAQVRIGYGSTPVRGAILDLNSKSGYRGGLLFPSVEIADLQYIPTDFTDYANSSVAERDNALHLSGTIVYNSRSINSIAIGFYVWNGRDWNPISVSENDLWKLQGNTVPPNSKNFIGTINQQPLVFKTANVEAMIISGINHFVGIGTSTPRARLDVAENILVNGITIGNGKLAPYSWQTTVVGFDALGRVSEDSYRNTAIGTYALRLLRKGIGNMAIGYGSLHGILEGDDNLAIGTSAMFLAGRVGNGCNSNCAIGTASLMNLEAGSQNVALGRSTISNLQRGSYNLALGANAGLGLKFGSNNITIGNGAHLSSDSVSNELNIANLIYGINLQSYTINGVGIGTNRPDPSYRFYVNGKSGGTTGWTAISDIRFKKDILSLSGSLQKILDLQGVSYSWRTGEFEGKNFDDRSQLGFIAQDVEAIIPQAVSIGEDGYYSLDYNKIIPVLVEAIKEQESKHKKEISEMEARISKLESLLSR
ncbi:hypothetical protein AwDysgo_10640 [Bacteroidales bacterium]|nr:hypothetical protein AwDysgo_10640 [Bacteroidales bacterium]